MSYRPIIIGRPRFSRALVLLSLAAAGCLASGCFQADTATSGRVRPADISAVSGPFSFGKAQSTQPRVAVVSAENLPLLAGRESIGAYGWYASGSIEQQDREVALDALNYAFARSSPSWNATDSSARRSLTIRSSDRGLQASAALYLDRPFSSLFAGIFKQSGDGGAPSAAMQGQSAAVDATNPFTEAKQKVESAAPAAADKPATQTDSVKPPDPPKPADPPADNSPAPAPVPVKAAVPPTFFLGDFDGDGILKGATATRLDSSSFAFKDGTRTFSLYINLDAVNSHRSFGIEDLNADGIPDLLVTSGAALFGGVLYGDEDGDFKVADSFLTGYDPTVATAGPVVDGQRAILSVNLRTNVATAFQRSDRYRRVSGQSFAGFIPDFISHIVETETGQDFLLAAQSRRSAHVFRWLNEKLVGATGVTVPTQPTVTMGGDILQRGSQASIEAYQIGTYASVVLSDGRGQKFNVANLRVSSRIFLAIGDLYGHGTLDVAVAYLESNQ